MELTPNQLQKLRKPFEKVGAFAGLSDEEIKKNLEGMMDIYVTLVKINIRSKRKQDDNGNKSIHNK